jgi:hypothetical protein
MLVKIHRNAFKLDKEKGPNNNPGEFYLAFQIDVFRQQQQGDRDC